MRSKDEFLRRRRNFLPTLIVAIFLWLAWVTIFFFVPPEYFLMPFLFLLITFLAVLFSASLVWGNTRRGLLTAIGTIMFMALRNAGIGNYLNLLLIGGILLSAEYYLSNR